MALRNKIDSNQTSLRIAEELGSGIGNLSGSEIWVPLEPNSYGDFGGEVQTVSRAPINADRQRKKGTKTDEDAQANFNLDFTQTNVQDLMQGFFFADFRRKGEETPTAVTATTDLFDVDSTSGFRVNDLVWASGFDDAGNNGLHVVTAIVADTTIECLGSTLVTDASPSGTLVVVGHQFGTDDLVTVAASGGAWPQLTTTSKNLTELGLVEGEWIWIGGDGATTDFDTNAANNGFKRVHSIDTNLIELDKSDSAIVAETTSGQTVRIFFGRVLKNEVEASQVTRTYQIERTLSYPDDSSTSAIQAQYEVGCIANEFNLSVDTADKINADMNFVALRETRIDGPTAQKAGTRNALVSEEALNTSSDVKRISLSQFVEGTETPASALFTFVQNFTLNINNQATPNKAIGTVGGFDISTGDFEVSGDITAYFASLDAVDAVNNVADISFDFSVVRSNAGFSVDMPLLTLGDGRPNVTKDEPITLPLSNEAADGSSLDTALNYTLLMTFYDYLPDVAEA